MTKEQLKKLIEFIIDASEEAYLRMDGRDTSYNSAWETEKDLYKIFGLTNDEEPL